MPRPEDPAAFVRAHTAPGRHILVPEIALTGVIETIPCSDVARESIHGAR